MYVPLPVTKEGVVESSTLPCRTIATLVPSANVLTYTLSLCTSTLVQSQSYPSYFVTTVTCPVTVYSSARIVWSPLALGMPWLPMLLLILTALCLVAGIYVVVKRDRKTGRDPIIDVPPPMPIHPEGDTCGVCAFRVS